MGGMSWRFVMAFIFLASGVCSGWLVTNRAAPAYHPEMAAPLDQGAAIPALSSSNFITTAVPISPGITPSPVLPTPTPLPPTPTPAPATGAAGGLPVVPVFLGVMFLGLVLAVAIPLVRSRLDRR